MLDHLAEVCVDLSRFHGVRDAAHLDSASFLAAAARLPWCEDGAVRRVLVAEIERKHAPERPATAAELMMRGDLGAREGWGPVFEVTRVPKSA